MRARMAAVLHILLTFVFTLASSMSLSPRFHSRHPLLTLSPSRFRFKPSCLHPSCPILDSSTLDTSVPPTLRRYICFVHGYVCEVAYRTFCVW
ncbi:hypothetical protein FPQ18DRAFT_45618 [Pyronema domesticum]|nr:hypothetical protein FPQ18DRAFT_45618 [Pyronema domesticum]